MISGGQNCQGKKMSPIEDGSLLFHTGFATLRNIGLVKFSHMTQ